MVTWKDIIHFTQKGTPVPDKRVEKTEEEWRSLLNSEVFRITRLKATESAFSGEYCESYEPGIYSCICCQTLLFDFSQKFHSKSGWPSFTQPIKENSIKYEADRSHGMVRVEILCNTCDSHLGHVFPDGPKPGGLRYCVNSLSLKKEN